MARKSETMQLAELQFKRDIFATTVNALSHPITTGFIVVLLADRLSKTKDGSGHYLLDGRLAFTIEMGAIMAMAGSTGINPVEMGSYITSAITKGVQLVTPAVSKVGGASKAIVKKLPSMVKRGE